jgi:hypothetical protein
MTRSYIPLLMLALVAGCNDIKNLYSVSGTVTIDGQSLSSGIVQFEPIGGGRPATGRLDSSGKFQMMTDGEAGARVGEYRVSVIPAGFAPHGEEDTRPPEQSPIPKHYRSPTESKLTFKVEANDDNQYDIALSSTSSP